MFLNIGQGNFLSISEIILLTNTNSVLLKRIFKDKENFGQVIDLTGQKPLNCIILTTSGFFCTSSSSKTLILKLKILKAATKK